MYLRACDGANAGHACSLVHPMYSTHNAPVDAVLFLAEIFPSSTREGQLSKLIPPEEDMSDKQYSECIVRTGGK